MFNLTSRKQNTRSRSQLSATHKLSLSYSETLRLDLRSSVWQRVTGWQPMTFNQGHYSTVTKSLKVFNDIANALYCNLTKMFWAITEQFIRVDILYPKRSASLRHPYSAKIVRAMIQHHSTEKATWLVCGEIQPQGGNSRGFFSTCVNKFLDKWA